MEKKKNDTDGKKLEPKANLINIWLVFTVTGYHNVTIVTRMLTIKKKSLKGGSLIERLGRWT